LSKITAQAAALPEVAKRNQTVTGQKTAQENELRDAATEVLLKRKGSAAQASSGFSRRK
jgi:hypothetical protein